MALHPAYGITLSRSCSSDSEPEDGLWTGWSGLNYVCLLYKFGETVYATTGGSPYVYRNFMVCTQRMGDNEMRRPRAMGGAY